MSRTETDLLGDREVPDDAWYGIHTLRAMENFPISGVTVNSVPELIRGMVLVKKAAALANRELGVLPGWVARASSRPVTRCSKRDGAWTSSRSTSSRAVPARRST